MDFCADQRGEAGRAEAACIGNGKAVARHEVIGQRHEIITAAPIGFRHILWRALPVAPKDKPSPIDRSYYADVDGWLCAALDTALVAVGLMPERAALDTALHAASEAREKSLEDESTRMLLRAMESAVRHTLRSNVHRDARWALALRLDPKVRADGL
jgi:hypothetical protein